MGRHVVSCKNLHMGRHVARGQLQNNLHMGSSISNGPTIPIPKAGSVRSPARAASATHEPASVFCDSPFHLTSSRQPWYLLPSSIRAGSRNPPSTTAASSSSHRDPSTAFSPWPTEKTAQQHLHRSSGPWQVGPESTRKTLLQRAVRNLILGNTCQAIGTSVGNHGEVSGMAHLSQAIHDNNSSAWPARPRAPSPLPAPSRLVQTHLPLLSTGQDPMATINPSSIRRLRSNPAARNQNPWLHLLHYQSCEKTHRNNPNFPANSRHVGSKACDPRSITLHHAHEPRSITPFTAHPCE
ncbi:hypothetical protein ACLOJK_040507 [Asimina triloba]